MILNTALRLMLVSLLMGSAFVSQTHASELPPLTKGETLYIPVYSQVLHGNLEWSKKASEKPLSVMLSIRNTDPHRSMNIRSIRYFDTVGQLVREYPLQPAVLAPFASTTVFLEHKDLEGGTGAKFVVEWDSSEPINAPIVETLHTYFFGNAAMVFVSQAQALHPQP